MNSVLFSKLIQEKEILPIDARAAYFLSKDTDLKSSDLLFAYLFKAARLGHLCVSFKNFSLEPGVEQIWTLDHPEDLEQISEMICNSYISLQKSSFFSKHPFLFEEDDCLYLEKNAHYEKEIVSSLRKVEVTKPDLEIESLELSSDLTEEQKIAVNNSLSKSISFITGGPGVGKTYTAKMLLEAYFLKFPKAKVAALAPTGKATSNLQKGLSSIEGLHFSTLHRLFCQKMTSYLPYDLVIVDESSMIDASFFLKLLKYHKMGGRLVFIGDYNQLPPVGSGALFKDLVDYTQSYSNLSKCLRTDIQDIVDCGQAVIESNEKLFFSKLQEKNRMIDLTTKRELLEGLIHQVPRQNPKLSFRDQLKEFQRYKILTAHRKGEFGSDALNQSIKAYFNEDQSCPIMVTKNDAKLELYNGDTGLLFQQNLAIFEAKDPTQSYYCPKDQVRKIPASLLYGYEWAYCLSVHKSQGSEYERVSIILPPKTEVFGRELLYTAITRAKKEFEIFSDKHTLAKLIKSRCVRLSGLSAARNYE